MGIATQGGWDELKVRLLPSVQQVMEVHDITAGGPGTDYLLRFRGRLVLESMKAYDRLEPVFAQVGMTLLFRKDGDQHVVMAIPAAGRPRPSNPWVNVALFVLTVPSVLLAWVLYAGSAQEGGGSLIRTMWLALPQGMVFAASLLAILLAHEFGHYLAARHHKTAVTLPYFLPYPGSLFGTLGAFIQLKAPPRNRRVLLDIGLAGPLAGLVVAIPVLLIGLALSRVDRLPLALGPDESLALEGNSILYLAAKYVVTGELLPMPQDFGAAGPVAYWLQYFFLGLPIPLGGRDVLLHPMAWAGWAGLLVTALNLIPAGQLDGGHALYVLLGKSVSRVWPIVVVALVALGAVWPGWWLWAALIFFLGRLHAQPLDDITPLDGRRKAVAILGLIIFVLVFTPVPLRAVTQTGLF